MTRVEAHLPAFAPGGDIVGSVELQQASSRRVQVQVQVGQVAVQVFVDEGSLLGHADRIRAARRDQGRAGERCPTCTLANQDGDRMRLVAVWDDDQATNHAWNLWVCDGCGSVLKDDVAVDKGRRWIDLAGNLSIENPVPPGSPPGTLPTRRVP